MFAALASVVILAALSSPHCVVMCGPLSRCASAGRRERAVRYHLGRLVGYAALGVVAGGAGGWLLAESAWLPAVAAWTVAALLLGSAWVAWRRAPRPLTIGVRPSSSRVERWLTGMLSRPMLCGGLTTLLPCGVLWAAAAIAVSSGSALGGAIVMLVFAALSGIAVSIGAVALSSLRRQFGPRPLAVVFAAAALVFVVLPLPRLAADTPLGVDADSVACPLHPEGFGP